MTTIATPTLPPWCNPAVGMAMPPCAGCGPLDPNAMQMFCPTIPDMAEIGTADTVVMVQGRNFTPTCQVHMDAIAQATTFISSSALSFVVKPSLVTTPGTSVITVVETAP